MTITRLSLFCENKTNKSNRASKRKVSDLQEHAYRSCHKRLMTRDFRISLIQTIKPKRCELLMHDTDRSPHPASSTGRGRCLTLHLRSSARLPIITSTKPSVLSSFSFPLDLCLTLKHRHRTLLLHAVKHVLRLISF